MMIGSQQGLVLFACMNGLGFALMGIDKWQAKNKAQRISERTLLLVAFCFGGLGTFLGMQMFRHKTKKPKFLIGVPLLIMVNLAVIWWLW